jgi:transketolase
MSGWEGEARAAAARIRARALEIAIARDGAYLGQACSSAELLATLHLRAMDRANGDVLVLSPAHYTLALYAMLAELGELSEDDVATYGLDGSPLEMVGGHGAPGMLFTTGSLAQGLSQAIGLALARRVCGEPGRVFVLLSDGELQEGQTWEAFLTLAHHELASVVVLLDLNDSQVDGSPEDVLALEPVVEKLLAFRLDAAEVDGHDPAAIAAALEEIGERPRVLACRTSISRGLPSLAARANLHFVRFRPGEAEAARADLERHLAETGAA